MKNKKINLKTLKNVLSEKELKDVIGGNQGETPCAGLKCKTDEDCPSSCSDCRVDYEINVGYCRPTLA